MTARALLVLLVVVSLGGGCTKARRASRRLGSFQPPALELPTLSVPQALPAARVLHIFFVSNVAGDIEPCG